MNNSDLSWLNSTEEENSEIQSVSHHDDNFAVIKNLVIKFKIDKIFNKILN